MFNAKSNKTVSESIHAISPCENVDSFPCNTSGRCAELCEMKSKSLFATESQLACESVSEPLYEAKKNMLLDYPSEDGGSITEDDFYSIHSEIIEHKTRISSILANSEIDRNNSEPVCEIKYESNPSFSQSSCYRSLSSNISDSIAFYNEVKNYQSSESQPAVVKDPYVVESQQKSQDYQRTKLVIYPPVIKVPSNISATLSHVVDPGDFWIQLENSHGSNLNFPK